MTLNSRQETFCHAYASGANGTQAARQAGYGTAGAANQASRLLQNPDVAERIGKFHADAAAAAEALAEINPNAYRPFNIVFADNRDAYWLRLAETHWGPHAEVKQIPPGISLITSSDRNDVSSARIRTYLPQFEKAEIPDPISGNWSAWQSLFASRMYDPDDGPEGAMMISTDSGFGTVSSSLIALPSPEYVDANPGTKPVYMFAAGAPVDAEYLPVVA